MFTSMTRCTDRRLPGRYGRGLCAASVGDRYCRFPNAHDPAGAISARRVPDCEGLQGGPVWYMHQPRRWVHRTDTHCSPPIPSQT